MSKRTSVTVADVTFIARLIAEAAEARADTAGRLEHILSGFSRYLDTRFAVLTVWRAYEWLEEIPPPRVVTTISTLEPKEQELVIRYFGSGKLTTDPALDEFQRRIHGNWSAGLTQGRDDLVPRQRWYTFDHVQEFRRSASLDPCIYSLVEIDQVKKLASCLTTHRAWRDQMFSRRQIALVQILHETIAPMVHSAISTAAVDLPPRLKAVLRQLLMGNSEKQAAKALGLTTTTVHTYVKALYRQYDVSSRGELLARFVRQSHQPSSMEYAMKSLPNKGRRADTSVHPTF